MKGISKERMMKQDRMYKDMYLVWIGDGCTLQELGERFNVTKQRAWQIMQRCLLGDGYYYTGQQKAREKWQELAKLYSNEEEQIQRAYNEWLEKKCIRTIANNKKKAPHTGWDF